MLPGYLLSLREGLEAALIVGIVLGTLRKMHREALIPTVWLGVGAASLVSALAAVLLTQLGLSLEGQVERLFEGATMLLAALVLTWMIFWMFRQAPTLAHELARGIRQATGHGGKGALFGLAFIAVLREGIELALFLTAAAFASDAAQTLFGALLGLGTALGLGWLLFATTLRLDLRRFFRITGILLMLFAAGLIAHSIHEFNELGWIPAIIDPLWNTSAVLSQHTLVGEMLNALFGYNSQPSLTEVIAYAVYLGGILWGLRRFKHPPAAQTLPQ